MRSCGIQPLTNAEAWAQYDQLIADPKIGFADEPRDIEKHWKQLASRESASPKLWMDAYLAAFAIAGNHQFVTSDKAFSQFAGLKLIVL
jgi:predicted nucleic acid-binding protein